MQIELIQTNMLYLNPIIYRILKNIKKCRNDLLHEVCIIMWFARFYDKESKDKHMFIMSKLSEFI